MRLVAILSAALLLSGCGEQKAAKPERKGPRPLPENTVFLPDGTRKEVTVYKKHPLYAILETEPRNEYERKLPLMMSKVINVDALQIFCSQWFPANGHDVADAYMAWRGRHEATIKELTGRSEAVWTDYVGEDKEYVRLVYPHLRKQMLAAINKEFDNSPVEKFKAICAGFPADLRSSKWDLEKRYRKELAFLRETPFTPAT
jgi:hypothetical protein